jgi:hypothetical protein
MKRIVGKKVRIISCAVLLVGIATALYAQKPTQTCSLSTLKGYYGMQGQGTVLQCPGVPTPFPLAEVGRDFLDGAGNIRGHFTANGDGSVVTGNLKGTYTANPDCTGTIALDGVNQSFVVLANGSLRLVDTDSWLAATRTLEKMPKWHSCSLSTLKGAYSAQGEGTVVAQVAGWPAPPFAFAEVAKYSLHGGGNLSGSFTENVDGTVVTGTLNGTYTVKPSCTGTIASSGGGLPFNQWFVVLRDGSLRLVQTDSWITITRTLERMPD